MLGTAVLPQCPRTTPFIGNRKQLAHFSSFQVFVSVDLAIKAIGLFGPLYFLDYL